MKNHAMAAALLLSLFSGGCVNQNAGHPQTVYRPTNPKEIRIFWDLPGQMPPELGGPYEVLGNVRDTGIYLPPPANGARPSALGGTGLIASLRQKAAALGANAMIITYLGGSDRGVGEYYVDGQALSALASTAMAGVATAVRIESEDLILNVPVPDKK